MTSNQKTLPANPHVEVPTLKNILLMASLASYPSYALIFAHRPGFFLGGALVGTFTVPPLTFGLFSKGFLCPPSAYQYPL